MTGLRIAALFDAENIDCDTAVHVMLKLRELGEVQSACAIGDFILAKPWVECGRDHGINLVMQPSLGKGKNSADICLTIEAMDLAHRGQVNAIALITHDRDFTPLAFRLREAGLTVMGFGRIEPNVAFRTACNSFKVIGDVKSKKPTTSLAKPTPKLSKREIHTVRQILVEACAGRTIHPTDLKNALVIKSPEIATKLSGTKRFLKTLVETGIVQRVGGGSDLMLKLVA